MALSFPVNPSGGDTYTDDCNNLWVYDDADNKWTIKPPAFTLDGTSDNIWVRDTTTGVISPRNANDELNMGSQLGDIDLTNFPEMT